MSEGPRPLSVALDAAMAGNERPLFDFLCRHSNLPGTRINTSMVTAFAEEALARGKRVDVLLHRMAALHADEAPGGTALEFLPVCATAAIGLRAASDPRARQKLLPVLHEIAEDMRFRVRDMVPEALASIGVVAGEALLHEVEPWMDGYFHAAAVLRALAKTEWLTKLGDAESPLVVERFTAAFRLLDEAPRAASRYPGYKALVDAIQAAPRVLVPRIGTPLLEAMVGLAKTKDPHLAELLAKSIDDHTIRARFGDEVAALKKALAAAAPVPRDPSRIVKGMRGRGKR